MKREVDVKRNGWAPQKSELILLGVPAPLPANLPYTGQPELHAVANGNTMRYEQWAPRKSEAQIQSLKNWANICMNGWTWGGRASLAAAAYKCYQIAPHVPFFWKHYFGQPKDAEDAKKLLAYFDAHKTAALWDFGQATLGVLGKYVAAQRVSVNEADWLRWDEHERSQPRGGGRSVLTHNDPYSMTDGRNKSWLGRRFVPREEIAKEKPTLCPIHIEFTQLGAENFEIALNNFTKTHARGVHGNDREAVKRAVEDNSALFKSSVLQNAVEPANEAARKAYLAEGIALAAKALGGNMGRQGASNHLPVLDFRKQG